MLPSDPALGAEPDEIDAPIVVSDAEASAHVDLVALTHHEGTQQPPATLLRAFTQVGPGLILAASIVGTGELINTTSLGAREGFVLLWLILFSCVIKVFVQVELGRYAITQGKTTLAAIDSLPGPRLGVGWMCWVWLVMMLATNGQIAAMIGLVGQAVLQGIWGDAGPPATSGFLGGEPFWATLTALAAIALLLSGGYKRIEKVTTALVAFVTAVTVLCAFQLPIRWPDLAGGLTFALPGAGLVLAFSAFGITGVGATELFAYPYWCLEKGYGRATGPRSDDPAWAERARGWLRVMRLDAWFSMVVFTLATVAFYLMGASVLHADLGLGRITLADLDGPNMIRTLSRMYVAVLGPWAREFFLIGAWAVLFKTLYVATAANARLTADFLHLGRFKVQNTQDDRDRVVRVLSVLYPLLALTIFLIARRPLTLVAIGGTAQALSLPLIAGAALYLRYRDNDPRVAPSRLSDLMTWLAFVLISVVATYSVGSQLLGWLR
jgi:Mn2+/Fe2+ NRAMP family transporter